jgi:nucleoside-diphosphate-sugar epimerase
MPKPVSHIQRVSFFSATYGALAALCLWFAYELRFGGFVAGNLIDAKIADQFLNIQRPLTLLWVVPLKITALGLVGQFRGVFYYFRLPDALRLMLGLVATSVVIFLVSTFIGGVDQFHVWRLPHGVILTDFNISLVVFVGFRVVIRALRERFWGKDKAARGTLERVAIVGAGQTGAELVANLLARRGHGILPVCFLDDNIEKRGLDVHGLRVIGTPDMIPELNEKLGVTELVLALPISSVKRIREISTLAAAHNLRVLTIPSFTELAGGKVRATDLRPVSVEDLLGREVASLDNAAIAAIIERRTVLVTGAGGSIGREICHQISTRGPARLILVDQCEVLLFQIEQELIEKGLGTIITPLIGDVTDASRMREIFQRYRPVLVLHAAAHKHVPMMESQPGEALKNNVLGTAMVAELASEFKAEQFVLISSDKAVNPTNVMGATKRLAEMIVQATQARPGNSTKFCAVRFGNVLGSSGSVIPLFKKQILAGGPVTLTHPDVQRYFMTIPEAVGLVLQCATLGQTGEILVLEMGKPLKIADVARQLIELSGFRPDIDIEIKIVGLRPGEKLVEELQHDGESYQPTSHPRIYRFITPPASYARFAEVVDGVQRLLGQERNVCKQGIKVLVPEYVPYME